LKDKKTFTSKGGKEREKSFSGKAELVKGLKKRGEGTSRKGNGRKGGGKKQFSERGRHSLLRNGGVAVSQNRRKKAITPPPLEKGGRY